MGGAELAADAMMYVQEIAPLLLIIGGVAFADLTIVYVVKLFKQMGSGKVKW